VRSGVATREAAEEVAHQDRPAEQEPRVLLQLLEEIRRGLHTLDGIMHCALDTLEHLVDIKQVQEALKTEGFHPGAVDGVVGRQTREALRAYQTREGLPPTGVLDEPTLSRLAPRPTCVQEGLATSYGHAWEGRQTAGGERFSADALTASHRTLPFGTPVRATNLATNQSVEVTINDRVRRRSSTSST
jgi:hypothetical protein